LCSLLSVPAAGQLHRKFEAIGRAQRRELFRNLVGCVQSVPSDQQRDDPLPVDLRNRSIYYVGSVNAVEGEAVGPIGSITATRIDKFVCPLLAYTDLLAMIGKAERGPDAIRRLPQRHGRRGLPALALHHLVTRAGIR
jgi:hypothetical protein